MCGVMKPKKMSEYDLGKEGEAQARLILKKQGYTVQSPDWLGVKDGKWVCFEIKKKERFLKPPFDGHGLDERQIFLRKQLFEATGIRTMLMIFEVPTGKVFYRHLDILENGKRFVTRNKVVIYPLENFLELL